MNLLAQVDIGSSVKINEPHSIPGVPVTVPGTNISSVYSTFSTFINLLVPLIFVIAGLILLFLLIGGGFSIIASGGNPKSVEGGQKQITTAIIGFFVIFAAYWIVRIIEIITGVPIFNSTL